MSFLLVLTGKPWDSCLSFCDPKRYEAVFRSSDSGLF